MSNINNTVNYEINVKQKYSWSTVFAWLYLKTIGRILPKKWNKLLMVLKQQMKVLKLI